MIDYPDVEAILEVHESVLEPHESRGILDQGAIAAAVARPQAIVFGDEAYPTLWEKAAALLESLARNHHPFVTGNKRTAWRTTAVFLTVNGHPLDPAFDPAAATAFTDDVAKGRYQDVASIAGKLTLFFR